VVFFTYVTRQEIQNRGVVDMNNNKNYLRVAILSVSVMGLFGTSYASVVTFKDIPNNFWGNANIQWAIDNKVVDGYPDGTFKPNQAVNQNEFVAMLIRALQPDFKPTTEPSNWATPFMAYATKKGWRVTSTDRSLSRGMVAQILTNATGKNYNVEDSIQYLLDLGLTEGKTAKSVEGFKKGDSLSRAEAVTFIQRFKQKYNQLQSTPATEEKYDDHRIVYLNDKYNFKIKLPKNNWEGKYEVKEETKDSSRADGFAFIDKANKAYSGFIFGITVWNRADWEISAPSSYDVGYIVELGRQGDKVFILSTPGDVNYDPNDAKLTEEYASMRKDLDNIITTFVLN
jgi:hypothetical protein